MTQQRIKVRVRNGVTIYETTDNRAAWEKRYIQYVDSLNADIKSHRCSLSTEMEQLSRLTGVDITGLIRAHDHIEIRFTYEGETRSVRKYQDRLNGTPKMTQAIQAIHEYKTCVATQEYTMNSMPEGDIVKLGIPTKQYRVIHNSIDMSASRHAKQTPVPK